MNYSNTLKKVTNPYAEEPGVLNIQNKETQITKIKKTAGSDIEHTLYRQL